MIYTTLALKSLWNRRFTTLLTIFSIALSVALFLGVERVRTGARESFSNTISKTHLIVGAPSATVKTLFVWCQVLSCLREC
jgi:putative ABC transport system permease protein